MFERNNEGQFKLGHKGFFKKNLNNWVVVICKKCGKDFESLKSRKRIYCGQKCKYSNRTKGWYHLEETKQKMRKTAIKRGIPLKTREKMRLGLIDWWKNINNRKLQSLAHIGNKGYWGGKKIPEYAKQKMSLAKLGKNYGLIGENHPCWIDGRSFFPYPSVFNRSFKKYIKSLDNNICQGCWKPEEEELKDLNKVLSIHHIDYNKNNCDPYNLITTCQSCNSRANFNRSYWINFYKSIIYAY